MKIHPEIVKKMKNYKKKKLIKKKKALYVGQK
jgi:hypothetical protein